MHFRGEPSAMMTITTQTECWAAMARKSIMLSSLLLITMAVSYISLAEAALDSDLRIVYAVNAGGYDHTDLDGIYYEADPLDIGTASDYGNNLLIIGRVAEPDEVLYRTERYHTANFGYNIPLEGDGDYALVLKFCEVYFKWPNMKIFDVVLNRRHEIVKNLDIFSQVGHGTAHDEYVYFKVARGKLHYKGEVSDIRNNLVRLEFIKGSFDNPKINAFALFKGEISQIPKLPPLQNENAQVEKGVEIDDDFEGKVLETNAKGLDHNTRKVTKKTADKIKAEQQTFEKSDDDEEEDAAFEERNVDNNNDNEDDDNLDYLLQDKRKSSKTSGPRQPNPYTADESWMLMPVFVAIGCFIPLMFCICKL